MIPVSSAEPGPSDNPLEKPSDKILGLSDRCGTVPDLGA
jgi:hypothetical protein